MNMQGNSVPEIGDNQWLCDLAFVVDISKHLSELNRKLQGPNQLLNVMFAKVKSFETSYSCGKNNFKIMTPFILLFYKSKIIPQQMNMYVNMQRFEAFIERFQDMKCKQMELDIFAIPFNVTAATVPSNFQHEIIELQTDDTLKGVYLNAPLVEFYINADDFPILRKHALKYVSFLEVPTVVSSFFSKLNLMKSRLHTRLTDENVEMELRIAASSTSADIPCLTKENNFQASHYDHVFLLAK